MPSSLPLARHDLLYLSASAWLEIVAHQPDKQLALWPARDWPVVVRRQTGLAIAQDENLIDVAISLPPLANGDKPRLPLQIRKDDVVRHRPALALSEIIALLPSSIPSAMRELASANLPLAVYGSCSWQAITGLPYVQPSSDVDLLFAPSDPSQLADGLRLLQDFSQILPLDGEIVFPGGKAVAWREWQQNDAALDQTVLVKTLNNVSLATRRNVLASFASASELCV